MNLSEKTITILYVVSIAIVLVLSILQVVYGNINNCNECVVEFKTTTVSGYKLDSPLVINVSVIKLIEGLNHSECPVEWSKTQGFIKNGLW